MLLLIDAGNTRVKWGLPDEQAAPDTSLSAWLRMESLAHDALDVVLADWQTLPVSRVLISNVAGEVVQQAIEQRLARAFPALSPVRFRSAACVAGMENHYRFPEKLGSDRFATAIGARALYPQQELLIATCGTATTVDIVSSAGHFEGGMILPGLKLMAESLAKQTAQLPQVAESIQVSQPFADNTDQAIVSGCIHAQTGAILQALQAREQQTGQPVRCLISGGAAPYLLPHLQGKAEAIPSLVLTGLRVVAQSHPELFQQ
jgi:type III pantothenate kinase